MLIKLADNIYILDGGSNQSQSVRGSHMAFGNYAHPGVVAGGILGNYAGTELGDHLFPSVKKVVLEKQPNKFMGIKFGEKVVGAKVVEEGSKFRRFFANNVLRGTMGALGTGAGAMLVANLRKNKDKDQQMMKQASVISDIGHDVWKKFKYNPVAIAGMAGLGAASGAFPKDTSKHKRSTASRIKRGIIGGLLGASLGYGYSSLGMALENAAERQFWRNFSQQTGYRSTTHSVPKEENIFFKQSFKSKAAAKHFHTELVRKNHPDLHPEQSDFFTKELQKVNAHWDDFRQSHSFEKLATFFNKKAMDLSIVTPMAENDAVNTAASAMNTNSLAKRFRQPGLVKMPSFGGSNVISPSVANFKQYGA